MMPTETSDAIKWALGQTVVYEDFGSTVVVTKETPVELVGKIREYFNTNGIEYQTFSYTDLTPYLN